MADTLLADKSYDASDRVIDRLNAEGKTALIAPRHNRKSVRSYDAEGLLISTPRFIGIVKSNQQSILNYPVSFSTPTSTVNSQQSTIIPVQPELSCAVGCAIACKSWTQ